MKKISFSAVAILILGFSMMLIAKQIDKSSAVGTTDSITVYNWGDYIDPDILKQFEQETGIKVIYETFDSNEGMMGKIEQGGTAYDITAPSEYMIEMMMEKDLLIPIDHSLLPNLEHLDPYFLDLPFDPKNKYSIPYFWGTLGIAFNPTLLEGQTFESWDNLWDPSLKQRVILVDSAREVIGMSLNSLHYSLNSIDTNELQQAVDKLNTIGPNVKAIIGDEVTQLMINREAAVALTWSGQAADMMDSNEEIDYIVPEEGSNLWFDNFVIPRTAKNIEGAHAFLNFLLRPDIAAQNTEYVGYSTPNRSALDLMDPEITEDERYYPDEELREHLEVYRNLGLKNLGIYNEHFLKFKMNIQ